MKEKRTLRFIFALWVAKAMKLALKLLGRNGTYLPGNTAIRLCPNFLGQVGKPKTVIGVTGTNGKTTVSNLVGDVLEKSGYTPIGNRFGSNTNAGIATVLLDSCGLLGSSKKELAVLEIDERMAPKILPYVHLDYLVITNLFRDSYKRNAHVDFISSILQSNIAPDTKLILNGEDLVSNHLCPQNSRVYFGIAAGDAKSTSQGNIIHDILVCPQCGAKLQFEYIRYNHIGRAHCPNCDFGSPDLDYAVQDIDYQRHLLQIDTPSGRQTYRLVGDNITDIYNTVTAVALLSELGLSQQKITAAFDAMQIVKTRFEEDIVGDKRVVMMLAKGQNPIACSRVFDFVRHQPGKKAVVLLNYDYFDKQETSENIAWLFDTDFEFLDHPDINQVLCVGVRALDYQLRCLMAGIPADRAQACPQDERAADMLRLDEVDTVFILNDLYTYDVSVALQKKILEKLQKGVA
ncbi:UDP-N-acetylmuramoylalanyl-D-glutamate--2%2C6-diaminopimelate ligase [Anaerotruncus sp. 2789STDY5834896]|uniref:Lipid II isoglutaminyl synthase (glutamine-hydrolyzing) subunit MurT n=1 Tax=uncultured Anaerotruncus sp. TaxID=905011 RepID=A0A1C6IJD6_9FIRM|nr:UDP-N-acetylmuramoylalanyl-D-glutamate--2%2C6-diaminopimelate ligase [uncultured Anaerotruncus sp.]